MKDHSDAVVEKMALRVLPLTTRDKNRKRRQRRRRSM